MPTFNTPTPISAVFDLAVGEIRLIASDREDTVVDVNASDASDEADVRAAEQTRVEYSNGTLRVRGPKRRGFGLTRTGSVDLAIELPTNSRVEAAASVGGVRAAGRLGDCRIRLSAGDFRLEDTAGVDLNTSMGAIEDDHVSGDAQCSTDSGSVRLAKLDGRAFIKNSNGETWIGEIRGDLQVKASNGSIAVDHARADVTAATANGDVRVGCAERGSVSLKSALGSIDLGILAGTAAHVDLHTSLGRVQNQLDTADRPETAETTIDVHAETQAGDILVRRAQPNEPS